MILVSDIVEENGKTVRQNNLEKEHTIPLGALVEIGNPDYPDEDCDGLRLFVVEHNRDCDGTPLYSMSFERDAANELARLEADRANERQYSNEYNLATFAINIYAGKIMRGFPDSSLKVIALPRSE